VPKWAARDRRPLPFLFVEVTMTKVKLVDQQRLQRPIPVTRKLITIRYGLNALRKNWRTLDAQDRIIRDEWKKSRDVPSRLAENQVRACLATFIGLHTIKMKGDVEDRGFLLLDDQGNVVDVEWE
jgi:hypothetical protein